MCVEAVSIDNVKCCKFDVKMITANSMMYARRIIPIITISSYYFVCKAQVNNNYEKSNVNSEIGCNRNFVQNPDDYFSNSAKSDGTSLSVDLKICNIDTVNNLADKVMFVSVK